MDVIAGIDAGKHRRGIPSNKAPHGPQGGACHGSISLLLSCVARTAAATWRS